MQSIAPRVLICKLFTDFCTDMINSTVLLYWLKNCGNVYRQDNKCSGALKKSNATLECRAICECLVYCE